MKSQQPWKYGHISSNYYWSFCRKWKVSSLSLVLDLLHKQNVTCHGGINHSGPWIRGKGAKPQISTKSYLQFISTGWPISLSSFRFFFSSVGSFLFYFIRNTVGPAIMGIAKTLLNKHIDVVYTLFVHVPCLLCLFVL
jgi:hypothetical protein